MNLIDFLHDFIENQSRLDFEWEKECQRIINLVGQIDDTCILREATIFDFDNGLLLPLEMMVVIFDKWLKTSHNSDECVDNYIKYLTFYSPDFDVKIKELQAKKIVP